MTWETLNDFLISPLVPPISLSWGLVLFVVFLLGIRFLPEFARKLTLLLTSVALIELATTPFYTFLLVAYAGCVYYGLFWLQWSEKKKFYCGLLAALTVLIFFILKDLPQLRTPWTGSAVHQFGIAFFVLRLLSVIVETGRGNPLPSDPLDYFIYQFFMPTFFQGPVERLHEFKENLGTPEAIDVRDMGSQLIRLITGGVKCYVVFRIQIFHSDFIVWKMYLNAISFYLAVSAASDFTIASCALAGYRLNENYDYPYFKRNLSQFWRSWHKTVSYWFRDYVYIPLGGNKHLYRNILIVFLLAALWYEASPAGLLWALWHILGLWILKFWQSFWEKVEGRHSGFLKNIQNFSRAYPKTTQCVSVLITFHYVILGWLPFFHLPLLSF